MSFEKNQYSNCHFLKFCNFFEKINKYCIYIYLLYLYWFLKRQHILLQYYFCNIEKRKKNLIFQLILNHIRFIVLRTLPEIQIDYQRNWNCILERCLMRCLDFTQFLSYRQLYRNLQRIKRAHFLFAAYNGVIRWTSCIVEFCIISNRLNELKEFNRYTVKFVLFWRKWFYLH